MAEVFSIEAQARTVIGKQVKALRRTGLVPAVVYGAGSEPIHVSCPYRPLEILLQKAGGTHLVTLQVDGTTHTTLVREVQRHKIRREILHVDFLRVDLSKKLHTEVPIVFVGHPKLEGELLLSHNITSVNVECLPTNIPEHIEVDVTHLTALGDQITVGDLPKIENVDYLSVPHEVIARIDLQAAAVEVDEPTAEATSAAEPEVIEKGKKEEEDF